MAPTKVPFPSVKIQAKYDNIIPTPFLAMVEKRLGAAESIKIIDVTLARIKRATPESVKPMYPSVDPSHLMEYFKMYHIVFTIHDSISAKMATEIRGEMGPIFDHWIKPVLIPEGIINDPSYSDDDADGITGVIGFTGTEAQKLVQNLHQCEVIKNKTIMFYVNEYKRYPVLDGCPLKSHILARMTLATLEAAEQVMGKKESDKFKNHINQKVLDGLKNYKYPHHVMRALERESCNDVTSHGCRSSPLLDRQSWASR